MRSTSTPRETRSGAGWLASATPGQVEAFLAGLSQNALLALPWLFEFWALPHQLPPDGMWKSWVIMGGRGAGKTRAGSEWVRTEVEGPRPLDAGRSRRVALVGETIDQVREVMVFGDSGILACSPPDRRPVWEAGRRRLVWPNGAVAQVFSAHEPESLRGPQFDAAWVDELAKWKKAEETWDMLQFALRLGDNPRQVVTTTPRNVGVLKTILKNPSTVVTHAPTEANRAYLAASFLEEVRTRYAGTRLGRQELDGVLLEDVEGAMWTTAGVEAARVERAPKLDRIVVAVDPPVTGHAGSDECGIVVVGVSMQGAPQDWRAVVLEDASVHAASPDQWARAALAAMERHGADRLVAEVNQGGDLVEAVIRQIDVLAPFKAVRATKGKAARAEPIAALYEQGRVKHLRGLGALEDQMCRMTVRGYPVFLDLPLMKGTEVPHAPHIAVTATPWPGTVGVWSAPEDAGYTLNRLVERGAVIGVTQTPLMPAACGLWDRGAALRVQVYGGTLASATEAQVLNGANAIAIGDGSPDNWEVFQFASATLAGQGVYDLSMRLRGQLGTDALMPAEGWPAGSIVVLLDAGVGPITLDTSARNLARHYRIGGAARGYDDSAVVHQVQAFAGNGLRPYAPVHLRVKVGSDGTQLTWVRRSRIDGDSWEGYEVPLGEERETYLVRVIAADTIRREVTVSAPEWTYTAEMHTADGGGEVTFAVAQVSDRFGPGPFRTVAA